MLRQNNGSDMFYDQSVQVYFSWNSSDLYLLQD